MAMGFSHEIYHSTTVLNEISLAAVFLHIIDLGGWDRISKKISNSKADSVDAQTLLSMAKDLGSNYEKKVRIAISEDRNKIRMLPYWSIGLTIFAMVLTSLYIPPLERCPYQIREWAIVVSSCIAFIIALVCVYLHETYKLEGVKKEEVDNFSPPEVRNL